ncbi:TniB family NTP-binding protein [Alteromonas ponticola]|uniref:AAA family ATPase n=1 Tax=Alteromonas ponticola TaxID=2720613 RepID=A0ABX1R699_9ALTE|nr:TniB family NTP-binding protein [Alteromonas ponticola]NMH61002.1 AAA family ATPase [Alteromonas ponticola]
MSQPTHHEIYINSHFTKVIKERLQYCLRSVGRNAPSGLIIEGPTGVGKTTTCEREQLLINKQYIKNGLPAPVYLVKSPNNPGTKDYYSEILAELGDHAPYTGTLQNLRDRLYKQLVRKQVKVLIFDEFQQLIEKRSAKVVRQTLDDIKLISDKFKIACVFVGTTGVSKLAENNEQAASRYPNIIRINYMKFNNETNQARTTRFISSFLKIHSFSGLDLDEYEIALRFFAATRGDLRLFVHLLDDATGFLTAPSDIKPLTLARLASSYKFFSKKIKKTNISPFTADIAAIEDELKVTNMLKASGKAS